MSFKLERNSVIEILGGNTQVMVYGSAACRYLDVFQILLGEFKYRIFDCALGDHNFPHRSSLTLEGRRIEYIDRIVSIPHRQTLSNFYKAALTNFVFENYKRHLEELPLIPLLFCIDISGDFEGAINPTTIASKDPHFTRGITHKELRRWYKICKEFEEHPCLHRVGLVAQKSVKFVKLVGSARAGFIAEQILPFWEADNWQEKWSERKELKKERTEPKEHDWRANLLAAVTAYPTPQGL